MDYNKFRIWVGRILGLTFLFFIRKNFNFYGLGIVACGFLIRIWASGYIHKNQEVTKAGPYKLLRHPLYLGNFLAGLGFTLFVNSWQLVLTYVPAFFLIYYHKMQLEERFLLNAFGADYQIYRETIPLFIPNLSNLRIKDNVPFSWFQVLQNKEFINLIGGAIVVLFLLAYQSTGSKLISYLANLRP